LDQICRMTVKYDGYYLMAKLTFSRPCVASFNLK
jgi:hypothetical protein